MIRHETPIAGAYWIEPEPITDNRGAFIVAWQASDTPPFNSRFVQSNLSINHKAGTLRGLHSQQAPYAEEKLVRVVRGAVFDVIVDIRPASPTYGQSFSIELSAENRRALYIPQDCLHGFQTLCDDTEVFYQVTQPYHPDCERGARFDDPAFAIAWPEMPHRILSAKDQAWPLFRV